MSFYVFTIEQIRGESENTYSEYAGTKKFGDEQAAEVYFYTRCAEVSNALKTTHTYMDIKIVNSLGGVTKRDTIGSYIES